MLSAARMAQMSRLLDEALELDAEARQRWLAALPPEDRDLEPALRRALLSDEAGRPPAGPLVTLPKLDGTGAGPKGGAHAGERIGPYVLVRPLGEGGMAEVWLARRADGAFKREVALKLPMLSLARKDLADRFARERDILAGLEHPHIARLYDAGVSAEGLPYLAMEYVAGERLTVWCDTHQLDIRERLKLFLQVLEAVQYAHGHHVVHRDIKPSNILVTESGQVRLLDFGVAKLLAREDEQTELTQLYGRALTPEYASPELVRGDPIDEATDVYSLGVVLYELVTGSRPYRIKPGAAPGLLEQAIATAQVERPSQHLTAEAATCRATTLQKLSTRLRGDLDAIVLKALSKAPEDRYAGAEALAADVRRYLDGEAVRARPLLLSYRFAKLLQRHQAAAFGLVPVAAIVAVAAGYALTRPHAAPLVAQAPAVLEAGGSAPAAPDDKSLAVLPFLDLSEHHDQEYFSDGLSEELIDRLSNSPDLRVISRTSSFYFKGKQATIGEIATTLHVSHVLEGSVRKAGNALRITAQLIRASDGVNVWSQTFDRTLSDIFKLQADIAHTVAAALKAALNERASQAAAGTSPEAYNLLLRGNYFLDRFDQASTDKAIGYYQKAIALDPDYALAWVKLADANMNLADNGWSPVTQASERAKSALERAIRIDPNCAAAHRELGSLYEGFYWDWERAQAEFQRAIALDPADTRTGISLAGLNEFRFARFDETIDQLRRALSRDPLDTRSLNSVGWTLYYAGRLEESAAATRQLLELNPGYSSAGTRLAFDLLAMGRKSEALEAAQKEGDEAWRLNVLPIVYWDLGWRAESDRVLHRLERKYAAGSAYNIAEVYAYRGETETAFRWLDRAYRQRDGGMPELQVDPLLRKLRADPRYAVLLARMKFTEPAGSRN